MSRMIDADVLIEKAHHEAQGMSKPFKEQFGVLVEWLVEKTPSIEPERKKGHWQVRQRYTHYPDGRPYTDLYCPFCGHTDHNGDGDYCGYCGANLMEGEQNGSDNKTD